ncbi:hypothetical protein [Ectopseudomonas oleovorans]|uniref:Uncharacterized protein n=1 Tax=Ectopseudomonas oleovorans TaxID=301 RepID=A0AA42Q8B3_ECTOL|nr:hypothetical protein [Pseudomonas oleovorans]MDH1337949.1 hypothetical protein [Pseudomonas oleovorans]MDH1491086.1 hypothetical protein [Pseudomonas oleovorans]WGG19888.1 hypothetical protein N5O83_15710 [Pseudomonas oleovorans]
MNTLSIDGWRKADNDSKSIPIGTLQFYVSEAEHLRLEQAEEQLQRSGLRDTMIDAEMQTLELVMPDGFGPLSECKWRVYLGGEEGRGQFHLVGYSAEDGCLIYSNEVMVDLLG